ncbi:MAG: aminomethyl-transferring glycine dehydrogenase subunit GcvPA [Candidatus Bathyarchaeota archaeon]|nr:aminomethyl-transferring glycine dehydrogenase subunit GcvPA [Candidatus Bathyarchaeota archaeon]
MTRSYSHPYIPNSSPQSKKAIMEELGILSIDELFKDIPKKFVLDHQLRLPSPESEYEVKRHVKSILGRNRTSEDIPMFLGAGCWSHYVPAVVENIVNRTEFLTSYTPYQSEISQGMLQLVFEYQSMICELTGMGVANSSLYDWASALGEAARMASRLTGRREILVPRIIHPERYSTLETYSKPSQILVRKIEYESSTGNIDLKDLETKISDKTAAVYIENPSYLGSIEVAANRIAQIAHDHEALFIVGVDPISLGILKAPGDYRADIVIGEGQPMGNHMNFGGPLLGILACRDDILMIRQMPGRIVGMTGTQDDGRPGFCMVLQTREQHIRRQNATSNICSNESLCAIASAVYLSLLGSNGLRNLGENIILKSHYAMKRISEIDGITTPVFNSSHFGEFTVNFGHKRVDEVHKALLESSVHGGKNISKEFPELGQTALYSVTETHSKADIDKLVMSLEKSIKGEN